MKGKGYFTFFDPSGNSYPSLAQACKGGFQDENVERFLEGEAAEAAKKDVKKLMHKRRAVLRWQLVRLKFYAAGLSTFKHAIRTLEIPG